MKLILLLCWCVLCWPSLIQANEKLRLFFYDSDYQRLDISAHNQTPFIREGEMLVVSVEVLTPTWFASASRFADLQISDAIVIKNNSFADNFSENVEGQFYAGQRREYRVYPQRAGRFVVPSISVEITSAQTTDNQSRQSKQHTLRSKPALFFVKQHDRSYPVIKSLNIQQSVELEQEYQVGDIIKRRIEINAQGLPAMLLEPIQWTTAHGFSQSSLPVVVKDENNRGNQLGQRVETQQYKAQLAGILYLPEITYQWFDGEHLHNETLQAVEIKVKGQVSLRTKLAFMVTRLLEFLKVWWCWLLLWVLFVVLIFLLCFFWRQQNEETKCFRQLIKSIKKETAEQIIQRYYQWRAHSTRVNFLIETLCKDQEQNPWLILWQLAMKKQHLNKQQKKQLIQLVKRCRCEDRLAEI